MSYQTALEKAWKALAGQGAGQVPAVTFFGDEYEIDVPARRVLSRSCNAPSKEFVSILLLHYAIRRRQGLPEPTGEWISFQELEGGESYYPAFRKRAIEPLLAKYGRAAGQLREALKRLPGRPAGQADAGIEVEAFSKVPLLVEVWQADREFSAEANMLFDRSIARIFCTEDVAVLGGFAAKYI